MVKVDVGDSTDEALPYSAQASRLSGFQEALPHIKDASYDLPSLSSGTQIMLLGSEIGNTIASGAQAFTVWLKMSKKFIVFSEYTPRNRVHVVSKAMYSCKSHKKTDVFYCRVKFFTAQDINSTVHFLKYKLYFDPI